MPFELDREFRLEVLADAPVLQELLHSQGWTVFWKHALVLLEGYRAKTLSGTKEEFEANKGLYEGVRRLMNRPKELIDLAKGLKET